MSKVDLISRQWCDIVFEGRNKEYGAYRLRAHAGVRNLKALITLLIVIAIVGVLIAVKTVVSNAMESKNLDKNTGTTLAQLEEKQEEKKEEKKEIKIEYEQPQQEKVAVKASIQFTVPKIVEDAAFEETKELKSQGEGAKRTIAIAAADYEGDAGGGINIDDLKENQKAGGTEVAAPPKEEEVVDNAVVEVPATFPGGESALLAYVAKNLKYPAIALEQELQGVVVLKFEVGKDGSVSRIKIVKGLSSECDKAAADVVKKLPRFSPAKQQGHPVPVWFTLPIRFQIQ